VLGHTGDRGVHRYVPVDLVPGVGLTLQREQEEFVARRNAGFGRPGYNLQQELKKRLQQLNGIDGY